MPKTPATVSSDSPSWPRLEAKTTKNKITHRGKSSTGLPLLLTGVALSRTVASTQSALGTATLHVQALLTLSALRAPPAWASVGFSLPNPSCDSFTAY
eukprot:jgi/Botrbrau1/1109/Bobra.0162s0010.1